MKTSFNAQAPKKPTNLSLNSDLLAEAKRLNINLSATLEKALIEEVNERKRAEWLHDNAAAIQACNELTENHGCFSDSFRVF
ncbi:type II toxin-antitoxin system CcdA family antitoxin [uncultured Tolumonas sp.]|uniref:type II toxin-antitoxin system CcdA family antitoxin n=1 Tax=uncultured Tolumonas sp. TaxID=263765 RepID=UPI002930589F|nr:type II toxin-antitoxin system CcdA family antitoxin [uncultured Tolumonas sp.]